ncbi:putative reverse transcriptase domain-containing protein [Tanacetum coccineum]
MTARFATIQARTLEAQSEALKDFNTLAEMLQGLDKQFQRKDNSGLYFVERIWVPTFDNVRTLIMDEVHATKYSIRYGSNRLYYDLRDLYWWPQMKKDIAMCVSKCLTCSKVKAKHQKPSRLLQQPEIPEYGMIRKTINQRDRSKETTDKIVMIKERLKAAGDHQKSYAYNRKKSIDFNVGDKVLLKVSPWKGVVRFGKRSKLSPRYIRPFKIVERVGLVAYRLRLLQELVGIYDTFHVSNLNECLADVNLHVPLGEIKIDNGLRFVEEPIEKMNHEVKKLKQSRIPIVKVRWNSRRGPKFTQEREDGMKCKYPQLFTSAMV